MSPRAVGATTSAGSSRRTQENRTNLRREPTHLQREEEEEEKSSEKRWKGKARATTQTTEGNGGSDGVVIPLDMVGSGVFDVAYTITLKVGDNAQPFPVQVDTGSSDLWLASTACPTSSCARTNGKLYNPSGATLTGQSFNILYLQGSAGGPIVWDKVEVGGYVVESQAVAAANNVTNEPLSPQFTGILGLALPRNSLIAQTIPPVEGNAPDGAAFSSNLFGITPIDQAPPFRFLSLSLERPGSSRVPSLLGIGRHPDFISSSVSIGDTKKDEGDVSYSTVIADSTGATFWKAGVRDISVWVDGQQKIVDIGRGIGGSVFPSAILDSGVPLILTTKHIADGIYGAVGVGPGADGMYYIPCSTPLNISITLDNRPPLSLHPLDVTSEPQNDNRAQNCIGLIQVEDSLASSTIAADMILGVPFLRNTYTVMAYSKPNSDGSFVENDETAIQPRLGLLGLTDPTVALGEFHTVRVLNQPLPSSTSSPSSGGAGDSAADGRTGHRGLSVGIIVLIALLSFFALSLSLFGLRFFLMRRRMRKSPQDEYTLAKRDSDAFSPPEAKDGETTLNGEEEIRRIKYAEYLRKERTLSMQGFGTGVTLVDDDFVPGEFGVRAREWDKERERRDSEAESWRKTMLGRDEDSWRKTILGDTDSWRRTIVSESGSSSLGKRGLRPSTASGEESESSPERGKVGGGYHQRTLTESENVKEGHARKLSVALPLLPSDAHYDEGGLGELGLGEGEGERTSMAGIGTARLRSMSSATGSFSLPSGVPFEALSSAEPLRGSFRDGETPVRASFGEIGHPGRGSFGEASGSTLLDDDDEGVAARGREAAGSGRR